MKGQVVEEKGALTLKALLKNGKPVLENSGTKRKNDPSRPRNAEAIMKRENFKKFSGSY